MKSEYHPAIVRKIDYAFLLLVLSSTVHAQDWVITQGGLSPDKRLGVAVYPQKTENIDEANGTVLLVNALQKKAIGPLGNINSYMNVVRFYEYRRYVIPTWVYPIIFISWGEISEFLNIRSTFAVDILVLTPLFFGVYIWSLRARKYISYWRHCYLVFIVPIVSFFMFRPFYRNSEIYT